MSDPASDRYARYTRLTFDRPHPKVLRVTMDNGATSTPIPASTRRSSPAPARCSRPAAISP